MNHKIYKKEFFFYFTLSLLAYFSLLFGFFNNENLAGGAIQDFNFYIGILNKFRDNFFNSFFYYKNLGSDHSPFFISLLTIINLPFAELNLINVKELSSNDNADLLIYGD